MRYQEIAPVMDAKRRTEIICNVEPWRAVLSDRVKIRLTFGELSSVHEVALSEKDELIEKSYYIATRLMNCEDDGPVVVAGKRNQTFDDIVGIICVEACRVCHGVVSL
jgi:hypothetical protein